MKKLSALLVMLFAIGQLSAKEIEPKSPLGMAIIKQGTVVKVFYRAGQREDVRVTIYNESGDIVFKEFLDNTADFMRPYNFSSLPSGEYKIELSDGQGKRYQTVEHALNDHVRVAHLTRLVDKENSYVLSVPNSGNDEILVTIYNNREEIVYRNKEVIRGNFAKLYNLDNIRGAHTFVILDKQGKSNRLCKPVQ